MLFRVCALKQWLRSTGEEELRKLVLDTSWRCSQLLQLCWGGVVGRGRGVSEPLWVSSAGKGEAVPVVISTYRDLANTHFRTPLITESGSFMF